jgi:hypothetical protein
MPAGYIRDFPMRTIKPLGLFRCPKTPNHLDPAQTIAGGIYLSGGGVLEAMGGSRERCPGPKLFQKKSSFVITHYYTHTFASIKIWERK